MKAQGKDFMRLFSSDKLALGMAICAFLLTLTLFCGLWRNMLGLSHAVDELRAAHADHIAKKPQHIVTLAQNRLCLPPQNA